MVGSRKEKVSGNEPVLPCRHDAFFLNSTLPTRDSRRDRPIFCGRGSSTLWSAMEEMII